MMPSDYQVPDDPDTGRMDAAYLRTCLGLRGKEGEPAPELPLYVRQAYYTMSKALSRLGALGSQMTPTQLATVVALAELTVHKPDSPKSPTGELEAGQDVIITWRKQQHLATFVAVDGDKVVVMHDGVERRISRNDITM